MHDTTQHSCKITQFFLFSVLFSIFFVFKVHDSVFVFSVISVNAV